MLMRWLAITLAAASSWAVASALAAPIDRCTELWYNQTLDHFSSARVKTWRQRYFVCEPQLWKAPAGPIFFYTGNESPVTEYINNTGFMFENAPSEGALIVFAEHRYFGASWPFGTEAASHEHLELLTYDQALADYAQLLGHIKQQRGPACCPAVALGGSYGGMLSFGFRAKYPWVVDGAIVASAPLKWSRFFPGYDPHGMAQQLTATTRTLGGQACVDGFRAAFLQVGATFAANRQRLADGLRLCAPPGPFALPALRVWMQTAIEYFAMGSYPYSSGYMVLSYEGLELPPYPMRPVCDALLGRADRGRGDAAAWLPRLADALGIYYNLTGGVRCFNFTAQPPWAAIQPLMQYLYCTSLGNDRAFAADGVHDMFWDQPAYTAAEVAAFCEMAWGVSRPLDDSNPLAALRHMPAGLSNMVFSNGELDFCFSGAFTRNVSVARDMLVVNIPMQGHHADLMFSNANDTAGTRAARRFELAAIRRWVAASHRASASPAAAMRRH